MDVNSKNEIPVQLAPVYYQYAIDRIFNGRGPDDTVSKALKCIGLYSVIVHMAIDTAEISRGALAARVGITHPGLIRPLEYLTRLGVVHSVDRKLPGKMTRVATLDVPRPIVESVRRDIKRRFAQPAVYEHGHELPFPWQDTVGFVLQHRKYGDTAAKLLKSLGLIPFMTRLAAARLPVTRPILARRLGVAENTITPLVSFLKDLQMIEVTERRIVGHIGSEFALTAPPAVVERVRREMRRLEKDAPVLGWSEAVTYRDLERDTHQKIIESLGDRAGLIQG